MIRNHFSLNSFCKCMKDFLELYNVPPCEESGAIKMKSLRWIRLWKYLDIKVCCLCWTSLATKKPD